MDEAMVERCAKRMYEQNAVYWKALGEDGPDPEAWERCFPELQGSFHNAARWAIETFVADDKVRRAARDLIAAFDDEADLLADLIQLKAALAGDAKEGEPC